MFIVFKILSSYFELFWNTIAFILPINACDLINPENKLESQKVVVYI